MMWILFTFDQQEIFSQGTRKKVKLDNLKIPRKRDEVIFEIVTR